MKSVRGFYAPVAPTAGVCWRRSNAALPPLWLVCVTVSDLNASLSAVREKVGKVQTPRSRPSGSSTSLSPMSTPAC